MRARNIEFGIYPEKRNIDDVATRAGNMGIYTVESMVGGTTMFFEDDKVVISTQWGYLFTSIDRAEMLAKELTELIPMIRQSKRDGRRPMDSRAIGKMLMGDFA